MLTQTEQTAPKPDTTTGSAQVRWWVVVAVVAVFGPYLVAGARTEQLVMYGSAGVVVLTQRTRLLPVLRGAAPVLVLWAVYAAVVVVGGLVIQNATPWPSGSLVAGLDNALLPLATIVAVSSWVHRLGAGAFLRLLSWIVVVALSVNAALAAITTYFGLEALPFLGRFWDADGYDASVAVLSEQMGRFSGVFNQPAEAGVAYSLAVLAALFLLRTEEAPTRRRLLWPLLVVLVVGGLLTLSKVFVLGGVLLAFGLAVAERRRRRAIVATGIGTVLGVGLLGVLGLAGAWGASTMLAWYRSSVRAGDSFLFTLSAGRFGTAGTSGPPSMLPEVLTPTPAPSGGGDGGGGAVGGDTSGTTDGGSTGSDSDEPVPLPRGLGDLAQQVLDPHPVFGVGGQGLQVAYDSAWAESIVTGGIVGLVLVVAVHVVLVATWLRARAATDRTTWLFAGAVTLLTVGASFGMPALTGNRESTLLWLFLVPLVLAPGAARPSAPVGPDASVPD